MKDLTRGLTLGFVAVSVAGSALLIASVVWTIEGIRRAVRLP